MQSPKDPNSTDYRIREGLGRIATALQMEGWATATWKERNSMYSKYLAGDMIAEKTSLRLSPAYADQIATKAKDDVTASLDIGETPIKTKGTPLFSQRAFVARPTRTSLTKMGGLRGQRYMLMSGRQASTAVTLASKGSRESLHFQSPFIPISTTPRMVQRAVLFASALGCAGE